MLFFDKEKDFVGVRCRSMNALLFCICYESHFCQEFFYNSTEFQRERNLWDVFFLFFRDC